jgi:agmatine/peptidylarginine deiminase
MDLEQAEQIVNKNRNKKLTENQIKEVIALAELLASCTIINLKKGIKNEKCNTLR